MNTKLLWVSAAEPRLMALGRGQGQADPELKNWLGVMDRVLSGWDGVECEHVDADAAVDAVASAVARTQPNGLVVIRPTDNSVRQLDNLRPELPWVVLGDLALQQAAAQLSSRFDARHPKIGHHVRVLRPHHVVAAWAPSVDRAAILAALFGAGKAA